MEDRQQKATEKIRDAKKACSELDEALRAVGVNLPSLRLDAASCVGSPPLTLIHLGRCNVATARALTAVLRPDSATAEAAS
ncbi:MAG: hypothetical protein JO362_02465 [Streptomycetaceae bacterium]|nr:hypothetical protein [Streptomycetaceae bacterium]